MTIDNRTLKEIYNSLPDSDDKITYESWLRKLHRFAEGNVRTTRKAQRKLNIEPPKERRKRNYLHQFVSYDGEGYGDKFVLLADSLGEKIVNPDGLPTRECLELLSRQYEFPVKRVWFSFSYDINNILRDVPDEDLLKLLQGQRIEYEDYSISYIPSKIFIVNNIKHYDVFSFFATNFIRVVEMMLGSDRVSKQLVEGKLARGTFEQWNIDDLIAYNDEELELLVEIMEKLRDALVDIGVKLTEWYGPGAIAKYWFKQHSVNPTTIPATRKLYQALQSAYYGGRFEQIQLGKIKNVYEYDIRSAYPSVMENMPYFARWRNVDAYDEEAKYSIWFVRFDFRNYLVKGYRGALPLPIRSKDGHICFPALGKGWYWQDELKVALEFFPDATFKIEQGYIASTRGTPFRWVRQLYDYRLELKKQQNLAQYAIKVGLNSLYGKTAQTVGSNIYHSLAWAGYITSSTRVKIARASHSTNPNSVIGFATDALFTTERLNLPLSEDLGDWEEQKYDEGIFFQSGVYRLERACNNLDANCAKCHGTGTERQDRYRGSPLRKGIDDIITQLKRNPDEYPSIKISRFISNLLAIKDPNAYGPYRLQFVNIPHRLEIDAPLKRHYAGFVDWEKSFKEERFVHDFSKILKQPITSEPKIWINDLSPIGRDDKLYKSYSDDDIISMPAKNKDLLLQKLIEDGAWAEHDSHIIDVKSVELLPVVEDYSEG